MFALLALLMLALAACSEPSRGVREIQTVSLFFAASSLDELAAASDLVVVAEVRSVPKRWQLFPRL